MELKGQEVPKDVARFIRELQRFGRPAWHVRFRAVVRRWLGRQHAEPAATFTPFTPGSTSVTFAGNAGFRPGDVITIMGADGNSRQVVIDSHSATVATIRDN